MDFSSTWYSPSLPTIDFEEGDHAWKIVVKGVPKDCAEWTVENGVFKIRGKVEKKSANSYYSQSFSRSFNLPFDARPEEIQSKFDEEGILEVIVPKKGEKIEEAKEATKEEARAA